jgi:hypothetical protein
MNVVTAKNLKAPQPSEVWTKKLRASLSAFAPPNDPRTAGILAENWPGRDVVHCIYSAGLKTIMEPKGLDKLEGKPFCWRFIAAGHSSATMAAGCWAPYELDGVPGKIAAAVESKEMADFLACTEQLNHLQELNTKPRGEYELRVLRVPALNLEAFWLKSQNPKSDLMVPYGLLVDNQGLIKLCGGGNLKKNKAYPVADFLKTVGAAAEHCLESNNRMHAMAAKSSLTKAAGA